MLLTYLFCLFAGGVLIALSLEGDGEADADGAGGNLSLLFSTPFWSFGLCGFGLSGLLLSLLTRSGTALPTVVLALGMGLAMGLAAARLLRLMGQREVDSLVRSSDLIGLEGTVTLTIEADSRGFVEAQRPRQPDPTTGRWRRGTVGLRAPRWWWWPVRDTPCAWIASDSESSGLTLCRAPLTECDEGATSSEATVAAGATGIPANAVQRSQ